MDIKQLRYFVTVVEEGNISAAAKKLHICQPPLSHQMKTLEFELGLKLMERGSRRVTLNEAGKLLYKRAKNILSLIDSAVREIDDLKNGAIGSISLGIASSCSLSIIQEFLIDYHKEFPQVNFKFTESNTEEIIDAVSTGVVELAIVRTPYDHDSLFNITLLDEPMVAIYNSNFKFDQENITLEDLKALPLVLYSCFSDLVTNTFYSLNIEPSILCTSDDVKTALSCVKSGLGVAILPYSTVMEYISDEELTVTEITNQELRTEVKLIYSNKQFLTRITQCLLDKIKAFYNN